VEGQGGLLRSFVGRHGEGEGEGERGRAGVGRLRSEGTALAGAFPFGMLLEAAV